MIRYMFYVCNETKFMSFYHTTSLLLTSVTILGFYLLAKEFLRKTVGDGWSRMYITSQMQFLMDSGVKAEKV